MALDDNPFAAAGGAASSDDAPAREDRLEPVPLDPGQILGRAWELFTGNVGLVLGALLLPILPAFAFGMLKGVFDAAQEFTDGSTATALMVASFITDPVMNQLVSLFFQLGAIRIYLHISRGQSAEIAMLVGEGRSYLRGLGLSFIGIVAVLVVFSPLGAAGYYFVQQGNIETVILAAAAYLAVLSIPMIIVGTGVQFATYLIVDRGMGPWEAIVGSWQLTNGYKMSIFGVNFIIGLFMMVVTVVTCGLGYLLAIPTIVLVQAVMYHSLTHFQSLQSDTPW